jgi:hypothetical protein
MKQSAVEWLLEQLTMASFDQQQIAINKAKEMEKQQIIDAMDVCQRTDFWVKYEYPEQYYNETFKNK